MTLLENITGKVSENEGKLYLILLLLLLTRLSFELTLRSATLSTSYQEFPTAAT